MREETKLRVLSTTAMIGDLVQQIGGDYIAHLTLIEGAIDPHSYELVKGDDEKISRAQVIFYNGLGLEHGASLFYALNHHTNSIAIGEVIARTEPERLLYVDRVVDPHIWMDVSIWLGVIDPIVDVLSQYDPDHASIYRENGKQLKSHLQLVDQEILSKMQKIPSDRRYLVTSHDAFNYYARRYLATDDERLTEEWKKRFQAPEGLAPDGQLGLHDIEQIIEHLATYRIQFLFPESNVSLDSLQKIHAVAKEKGIEIYFSKTPLFGDSMCGERVSVSNYADMLLHNAKVIEGFLNPKE